MNILVTGSSGFIGFHLTKALLKLGHTITGIDNLNNYYDPQLKHDRNRELEKFIESVDCKGHFTFTLCDISDQAKLNEVFEHGRFEKVINLAAQAGVRYSIDNPKAYIDSNLVGFANILESCRQHKIKHLIYASSSSVYGMNTKTPFSITDNVDHPISLYAATKKSNELMAHTYSHLFDIPTTGLRFFTVYGPWGRPDMAYYSFTRKILKDEPIDVYNFGQMKRDFTYIDDIVDGIVKVLKRTPTPQSSKLTNSPAPYQIYNIGNNNPITLDRFIKAIEIATGKVAIRNNLPMQPGDVPTTYADISELTRDVSFSPSTKIEVGIAHFVKWFNRTQR
jgi:UDP-glucuronate 4-epimerase